jgi:hypothetical protein
MPQLTLLIYLHDDPPNDLVARARYVEGRDHVSLLERDGVIQLSNNALLFDQTKSHDVFVQLCREIVSLKRPYLVVSLAADAALVVGPLSKEVQASLSKYDVPQCQTSKTS